MGEGLGTFAGPLARRAAGRRDRLGRGEPARRRRVRRRRGRGDRDQVRAGRRRPRRRRRRHDRPRPPGRDSPRCCAATPARRCSIGDFVAQIFVRGLLITLHRRRVDRAARHGRDRSRAAERGRSGSEGSSARSARSASEAAKQPRNRVRDRARVLGDPARLHRRLAYGRARARSAVRHGREQRRPRHLGLHARPAERAQRGPDAGLRRARRAARGRAPPRQPARARAHRRIRDSRRVRRRRSDPAAARASLTWRSIVRRLEAIRARREAHRAPPSNPLFAPLPFTALDRLAESSSRQSFEPGAVVMRKGEPGDSLPPHRGGRGRGDGRGNACCGLRAGRRRRRDRAARARAAHGDRHRLRAGHRLCDRRGELPRGGRRPVGGGDGRRGRLDPRLRALARARGRRASSSAGPTRRRWEGPRAPSRPRPPSTRGLRACRRSSRCTPACRSARARRG